ncbi:methylated-DNA--[protein]-cysteine S-methyltransferase [Periweissella fabaria]|uniref:Methylated-DNA--protein-cysteine methyltransferase, inducible n=1 Tax=Periweissella fabaria TaxID=546157 RepID=A0ABM8Z4A1_9LACO|nr:methylated-DNA--[protein]-cysteine S-methyltransferase [Periweissella fabaria]MCM0597367.1 methylated-DNA--[protein]-cysteine S-methyltransferase [Periweissella fabaria]CAH0416127.1 Methylated-DNA--protein-cysteine methyltransferase, inducible [Periweissella fabaria]
MQTLYFQPFTWQQYKFTLIATNDALVYISTCVDFRTELTHKYGAINLQAQITPILTLATSELSAYFDNPTTQFTVPHHALNATPFQQLVWHELEQLTPGTTISYHTLAQQLKRPTSTRAVANAVAQNPLLIIVPCHRVILSSGQYGNYRSGKLLKQALLIHEALVN